MPIHHALLQQQLERHFGDLAAVPRDLQPLLDMVAATYAECNVLGSSDARAPGNTATANREIEASFAEIVESSLDAIIAIDERQCLVLFNPAAERIFQCSGPPPSDIHWTNLFRRAFAQDTRITSARMRAAARPRARWGRDCG